MALRSEKGVEDRLTVGGHMIRSRVKVYCCIRVRVVVSFIE